jgi:glycosyltransferase involved in cell wall biosynthesis
MIYELFPEYFPSSKNFLDGKLRVLRQASKIIAISETTKKDLIKVYNLSADKIDVVYLASSLNSGIVQHTADSSARSIPERYLLYVGNRDLYKNFLFFIEAITPLLLEDKSLSVVCAGGKDFSRAELKLFTQWGIEKQLHYCSVDDILLSSLYCHAEAFVFPSLYEGFGIPILEAFACDCPVLISNTGSLPEIAGDAAVQFDPRNRVSVHDAVKRVLSSTSLQGELREKGKKRAQLFSWERTARETKQVYTHVLQKI